jgi:hypothetical protein
MKVALISSYLIKDIVGEEWIYFVGVVIRVTSVG